jgi:nitroreductase
MRDFFDVVAARRSIRKFKPEHIPIDEIKEIVRIGTLAPSASNKQMWRFIAITNQELIGKVNEVVMEKMNHLAQEVEPYGVDKLVRSMRPYATLFRNAPALLVVLQEPYSGKIENALLEAGYDVVELAKKHGYSGPQSIGAAIQNILLAAEAKGYGACWMCAPLTAQYELCELLNVSAPWSIAAIIPIGVPDEAPAPRPRKPLEEVFTVIE